MSSVANFAERGVQIAKLFNDLESLEDPYPAAAGEESHPWMKEKFENEADRFKLWAVNLGVFVSGHGSLDYRLREAQGMRETLQRLISSLEDALRDVFDYLTEEGGDVGSDELSEDSERDEPSLKSDLDLLLDGVKDPIDALFKLSVWIRNPVTRLVSSKARHFQQIDEETNQDLFEVFRSYDKDCISSLFLQYRKDAALQASPKADPLPSRSDRPNERGECKDLVWEPIRSVLSQHQDLASENEPFLVGRIAQANLLRRRQFAYWKRHRDKAQQRTAAAIQSVSRRAGSNAILPDTLSPNLGDPTNVAQSVTTATHLNPSMAIDEINTTASVSEYAPSSWSPSKEDIRFPPPPKVPPGNASFTCPYCFIVCPRKMLAQRAWEAHLIRDLRPYVCTYENCQNPDQLYDSIKDWTQHENTIHRSIFRCPEHQDHTFTSLKNYEAHIKQEHSGIISHLDHSFARLAGESTLLAAGRRCPICSFAVEAAHRMQSHIARHLERFSLFSLPRSVGCDDNDEDTARSESARAKADSGGSRQDAFGDEAVSLEFSGDVASRENESRDGSIQFNTAARSVSPDEVQERTPTVVTAAQEEKAEEHSSPQKPSRGNEAGGEEPFEIAIAQHDEQEGDYSYPPSIDSEPISNKTDESRGRKLVVPGISSRHARIISPPRNKSHETPLKGILKQPRASFPEEVNPIREGVEPHRDGVKVKEIPPGARWTKISREIVSPEALANGKERFEERKDFCIVLRVMTKEEIQAYAASTQVLRESRRQRKTGESSHTADHDLDHERDDGRERESTGDVRTNILGPTHPNNLAAMNDLASKYMRQGRWEEAEKLVLEIIETNKAMFGADHPPTLESMNSLATLYIDQGRFEEAEKLLVEVIETRKVTLGASHTSTLTSMNDLAAAYRNQGRLGEAEKLLVEVIETRKVKLGASHTSTLGSMGNLAMVYLEQGRWEEAEELTVEVTKGCKAILGADHPSTLKTMNNLASVYIDQERWEEAEMLLVEVMEKRKATIGADHPSTLKSMNNLALAWHGLGRQEEAIVVMQDCVDLEREKLGDTHPDTQASVAILQSWRAGLNS